MKGILGKVLAHKLILIFFVVGILLGVGGGFVLPSLTAKAADAGGVVTAEAGSVAKPTAKPTARPTPEATPEVGPIYVIKDKIVNLADPGGRRYLRYSIGLEFTVSDAELAKVLTKGAAAEKAKAMKTWQDEAASLAPLIDDRVTSVMASHTFAEVSTPEGKDALKVELRDRINDILPGDKVANVFLTDFVIQ